MKKEVKQNKKLKATIQLLFILGVIFGIYVSVTQLPVSPVVEKNRIRSWKPLLPIVVGENDPGAPNQSGVLHIYVVSHRGNPTEQYKYNITLNSSVFGNTFTNNSHNMSDIPYSTLFDVVVKVRWNKTHAFATNNHTWMLQWVNATILCPELGITGTEDMNEVNMTTTFPPNSQYIWVTYYANNAGAGYTINKGQNVSHCYFNFWAYY